jgi:hypothetical protein
MGAFVVIEEMETVVCPLGFCAGHHDRAQLLGRDTVSEGRFPRRAAPWVPLLGQLGLDL